MSNSTEEPITSKITNALFEEGVQDPINYDIEPVKLNTKVIDEYMNFRSLPSYITEPSIDINGIMAQGQEEKSKDVVFQPPNPIPIGSGVENTESTSYQLGLSQDTISDIIDKLPINRPKQSEIDMSTVLALTTRNVNAGQDQAQDFSTRSSALIRREEVHSLRPTWHAPWKLMRVISGHLGWVRCISVEPGNKWFATGSGDRTIKIWDLASGTLKLTLTGHIASVRGVAVSPRHPYLFSCGEDKMVKCWDLETNKVIRHYHGHLSGVYTAAIHPVLDVLVTAGRDSTARVWDMRTKACIHTLTGHKGTVSAVQCQEADPQVITGSMDSTVKLFDLAAGKTMHTLTHHKKSVRSLALHPKQFSFLSGASDNIKQFKCPQGEFVQNFSGHNSIVNTLSVNEDNVVFSGADNGSMKFWDWKSGHCFQTLDSIAQPGSLESEAGIFCSSFDRTGIRLITGEADKTIKIWKEDSDATEDSYPLDWKPKLIRTRY